MRAVLLCTFSCADRRNGYRQRARDCTRRNIVVSHRLPGCQVQVLQYTLHHHSHTVFSNYR